MPGSRAGDIEVLTPRPKMDLATIDHRKGTVNPLTGPLAGIRVVDFSASVSGPLAAMWLADQGAQVIKVEPLEVGDVTRSTLGAPELSGLGGLFLNCNRGKRSIGVDVATVEGRNIVLDLCRRADVFIQNWRPGVADRLGVGYDDVAAIEPDIIYVSISGFGPDGPYAQRRVYDPVIQGLTGHVGVQVNPEIPFPDLVRTIVCDKATALTASQAITAALFARERGTGGQHLQIPMLDSALAFFFPDGYMTKALLDDDKADSRPTMATVYRVNPTADGYIIYHTANLIQMHALFRALGHPEWQKDPRFTTTPELRRNAEALGAMITSAIEDFTTADLALRLDAEDVAFAPVLDLDQVQKDPQISHNRALRIRDHPQVGRVLEASHPVTFSKTEVDIRPLAPLHGQHDEEILRELGRDDQDIAALRAAGVISRSPQDNGDVHR
jgi:crotonobetainyl-CoA:carnitine CoA-transferase CaiB-like acyl-CoA transferase